MTTNPTTKKVHHGRNIRRFREWFDMKQETLATELGDDWNQSKISRLEEKENIDEPLLQEIAKILKVPVEAIKNFDEQTAINVISNTVNNHDSAHGNSLFSYYPTINPTEKWMEVVEENKRLYERIIAGEKEKVALLEKLLNK